MGRRLWRRGSRRRCWWRGISRRRGRSRIASRAIRIGCIGCLSLSARCIIARGARFGPRRRSRMRIIPRRSRGCRCAGSMSMRGGIPSRGRRSGRSTRWTAHRSPRCGPRSLRRRWPPPRPRRTRPASRRRRRRRRTTSSSCISRTWTASLKSRSTSLRTPLLPPPPPPPPPRRARCRSAARFTTRTWRRCGWRARRSTGRRSGRRRSSWRGRARCCTRCGWRTQGWGSTRSWPRQGAFRRRRWPCSVTASRFRSRRRMMKGTG
mmetsp:Transcript_16846/g.43338  ORF Transcript_16846/g.43338 Transcript_16846/m.43338 type:complete len:264 (+) Transcript_16846:68-859(+)